MLQALGLDSERGTGIVTCDSRTLLADVPVKVKVTLLETYASRLQFAVGTCSVSRCTTDSDPFS
jgi:hypothetical protein